MTTANGQHARTHHPAGAPLGVAALADRVSRDVRRTVRRAKARAERAMEDGRHAAAGLVERFGDVLRERTEQALQQVAQIARTELDRLESRLLRAAVLVGALAAGAVLAAVGLAGALGAATGRPWLGQILAGVGIVVGIVAWRKWSVRAARRRR